MKIEYNQEKNVITVGKAEFSSFTNFDNALQFAYNIFDSNGVSIAEMKDYKVVERKKTHDSLDVYNFEDEPTYKYLYTQKQRYKAIGDVLGCSLSVFYKNFQALQRKAFIVPVYGIYQKLSDHRPWRKLTGNKWNTSLLDEIYAKKDKLVAVYEDGLYPLLPLVYTLNRTPQELRALLKSNWKVLANNSLHKNKKISQCIPKNVLDGKDSRAAQRQVNAMETLCTDLPTSLLEYLSQQYYSKNSLQYVKLNLRGNWGKKDVIQKELRIFMDAERMAESLGEKVNMKWTPRRLKEEHDRMSKEITARKYSRDLFDSVKDVSVKSLNVGEYTATLLDNAFSIADEGNAMGHCVAGYADSVRQGNYLVYSVTKAGERSSTIGLNKGRGYSYHNQNTGKTFEDVAEWKMQQQYGRYNASVKDQDEKDLADNIVKLLNEKKLDNSDKPL
jgi:hypothetical protein